MAVEPRHVTLSATLPSMPCAQPDVPAAPASNLAALLDRFTQSMTAPETQTVGDFAQTVQALHGELALLAHHFGELAAKPPVQVDFDDIFPVESFVNEEPVEPGIAASDELEHACGLISQG